VSSEVLITVVITCGSRTFSNFSEL